MPFPFYHQHDAMDCGPACLRMVAAHHGRHFNLQTLSRESHLDREGVSLAGISKAAETIGFRTMPVKIPFASEEEQPGLTGAPLPCIAHWNQQHFVVVFKISKSEVHIADPAEGIRKLSHRQFLKSWSDDEGEGLALLLEPTPAFYDQDDEAPSQKGFSFLFQYLRPHRRLLSQLILGMVLGSIFQLIFPFLTQSVVDVGIQNQDLSFVWLVLIGQLMLFVSQAVVQFIQNWILLHVGTRVNVALIADYLSRLMKMPLSYFDTKMTGDLLQRIGDHHRIESFLTSTTLSTVFSVFNLLIFSLVLLIYHWVIFLVFALGAALYIAWIFLFLKKREQVDYRRFQHLSDNQNTLIELIQGMPEIKLQNSEEKHRRGWTEIQAKLFRTNIRSLSITQYQDAGALFVTNLKDIIITFIAARAVINGQMTLGMLLAVQYIVGMMNVPLQQFIHFIRAAQDARISLERISTGSETESLPQENKGAPVPKVINEENAIEISGLSFRYNLLADWALRDVNLEIPKGKITAIVGGSGSGKTTLIKLLLGFYEASEGSIKVGRSQLKNLDQAAWRARCGAVLQDGFIFSDTIANNIAESETAENQVDMQKLDRALDLAHIRDFVENLPLGHHTRIGATGNGISAGQRQRLLIARAVYKNPDFIFFDEATNALDAHTEKIILENLQKFFAGKTVIVVAHRLSTVKNADNIVVLENGSIIEAGAHAELIDLRGAYYRLVREQLALGA